MRVVVWGSGIVESATVWECGEATGEAVRIARELSLAWEDLDHTMRFAVEVECPTPDDVFRLVEETAADDAVLGWSPAPKGLPTAWFLSD